MTVLLTTPLQKSLNKLLPSSANENDAPSGIASLLKNKTEEVKKLIAIFEKNLDILEHQKQRCIEIIGILEEAAGLTIRARNFMTTPQDAEKYKDKINDTENLFRFTLEKLNKAVQSSGIHGINLTNGEGMITPFDDKSESVLNTQGIQLTTGALGIREPDFSSNLGVQNSRIDIMNAIDMAVTLRNIILSDMTTLSISRDFSIETIATSDSAERNLSTTTAHTETTALKKLVENNPGEDTPLAEPAQQDILNSFAASPNMEAI